MTGWSSYLFFMILVTKFSSDFESDKKVFLFFSFLTPSSITSSDFSKTLVSKSNILVSPINSAFLEKNWTLSRPWKRNLVDNKNCLN